MQICLHYILLICTKWLFFFGRRLLQLWFSNWLAPFLHVWFIPVMVLGLLCFVSNMEALRYRFSDFDNISYPFSFTRLLIMQVIYLSYLIYFIRFTSLNGCLFFWSTFFFLIAVSVIRDVIVDIKDLTVEISILTLYWTSAHSQSYLLQDRKMIIKKMKDHVGKMASDQFGSMVRRPLSLIAWSFVHHL